MYFQGAGAAATWTSNLSILMAKFPERKSTVKAWCDAAFNFGLTIGPVLGALMYDAGGFFLPFEPRKFFSQLPFYTLNIDIPLLW